jgi:DNA-binding NtrC family response regulator
MKPNAVICDRDAKTHEACGRLFADYDFDAHTADGGVECVTLVRDIEPSLLVLDVDALWGGVDGVLDCLDYDSSKPVLPLVVVTGREPPDALSDRTGVPRAQCLQKPLRYLALAEGILAAAEAPQNDGRAPLSGTVAG